MAALTAARSTKRQISSESPILSGLSIPVKAATKCIQGGIAVIDAGYAAPGRTAVALVACGIFEDTADNTAGANGTINARVRRGTFKFVNNAGDITAAMLGLVAYIVDDQTVSSVAAGKSTAGKVMQIDSDGVWVELY